MVNLVKKQHIVSDRSCKRSIIMLIFCWVVGISIGLYISLDNSKLFVDLIEQAATGRALFIGCTMKMLMPLFISVVSILFFIPAFIYAVCFTKAIGFACCFYAALVAFNSASWLVTPLLLFSDLFTTVVLLTVWFRFLLCRGTRGKNLAVFIAISILICLIDYFIISPFLASLMHYS